VAAKIGTLRVDMYANTIRFQREMRKAASTFTSTISGMQKSIKRLKNVLGALGGAFAIKQIAGYVRSTISAASEIAKAADTAGLAIETYQGLQQAAEEVGIAQEQFTRGLERFARVMGDARQGVGEGAKAFEELGINVRELTTEQALFRIADAVSQIQNESKRAAIVMDLFGRSGARMGLLFRQSSKNLKNTIEQFKEMGLILDESLVRNAEKADDALRRMEKSLSVLAQEATLTLAPAITKLSQALAEFLKQMRELDKPQGNPLRPDINFHRRIMDRLDARLGIWSGSAGIHRRKPLASSLGDSAAAVREYRSFVQKMIDLQQKMVNERYLLQVEGLDREIAREKFATVEKIRELERQRDEILEVSGLTAEQRLQVLREFEATASAVMAASSERIKKLRESWKDLGDTAESELQFEERIQQRLLDLENERLSALREVEFIRRRMMTERDWYQQDVQLLERARKMQAITEEEFRSMRQFVEDEFNGLVEASRRTAQLMESTFSDFFFGIMQGHLDNLVERFKVAMDRIVADMLARRLFNTLQKAAFGAGGIFSFFFGGTRQEGGPVQPGRAYLVGERGPELFMPKVPGVVMPEPAVAGPPVQVTINVSTPDAESFRRSGPQIMADLEQYMQRIRKRYL